MVFGLKDELGKAQLAALSAEKAHKTALDEIRDLKLQLDSKEQVCVTIKSQVDNLVSELERMQQTVLKKEKSLQDKLAKAKGKL